MARHVRTQQYLRVTAWPCRQRAQIQEHETKHEQRPPMEKIIATFEIASNEHIFAYVLLGERCVGLGYLCTSKHKGMCERGALAEGKNNRNSRTQSRTSPARRQHML